MHRILMVASACACVASGEDLPYNEETALKYAHLSVAAYCGEPRSPDATLETWQCGPACDAVPGMKFVRVLRTDHFDDAFAFVGKLDDQCVLSFRGTTNLAGWIQDIEAGKKTNLNGWDIDCSFDDEPCQVGYGWVRNYYNIADSIRGNLSEIGCGPGSSITVTGHSLGAAEAGIAMIDLHNLGYTIAQTYTFGQPRIGNSAFSSAFQARFGTQRVMRLVHYYDPVPHLPPKSMGFSHIPQEIYYQRDTTDGFHVCDSSGEDKKCGGQFWNGPWMIADCLSRGTDCDHLSYLKGLLDVKMDGESCAGSYTTSAVSV